MCKKCGLYIHKYVYTCLCVYKVTFGSLRGAERSSLRACKALGCRVKFLATFSDLCSRNTQWQMSVVVQHSNLRRGGLPSLKLIVEANNPNGKAPIPKDI